MGISCKYWMPLRLSVTFHCLYTHCVVLFKWVVHEDKKTSKTMRETKNSEQNLDNFNSCNERMGKAKGKAVLLK